MYFKFYPYSFSNICSYYYSDFQLLLVKYKGVGFKIIQ